jgi:hypothetical protein
MRMALCDSEGFQVDSPDGRVGFVERILFEDLDTDDAPAALVVRVGLFGRNTLLLDAADVRAVDLRRRRVTVPASPRVLAPGALLRLKERDEFAPECRRRKPDY